MGMVDEQQAVCPRGMFGLCGRQISTTGREQYAALTLKHLQVVSVLRPSPFIQSDFLTNLSSPPRPIETVTRINLTIKPSEHELSNAEMFTQRELSAPRTPKFPGKHCPQVLSSRRLSTPQSLRFRDAQSAAAAHLAAFKVELATFSTCAGWIHR